jgi:hypothetical protein
MRKEECVKEGDKKGRLGDQRRKRKRLRKKKRRGRDGKREVQEEEGRRKGWKGVGKEEWESKTQIRRIRRGRRDA